MRSSLRKDGGVGGPFYPLPHDEILAVSKLIAFAGDNFNVAKLVEFFFERLENIVGKRRKCWLPAFSPFPTMFSKGCFSPLRASKVVLCGKRFLINLGDPSYNSSHSNIMDPQRSISLKIPAES